MINGFTLHDTTTASTASTGILDGVQKSWGLISNYANHLAQTPPDAFMKGAEWSAPGKLKPAA
jgi:hypothetical protein